MKTNVWMRVPIVVQCSRCVIGLTAWISSREEDRNGMRNQECHVVKYIKQSVYQYEMMQPHLCVALNPNGKLERTKNHFHNYFQHYCIVQMIWLSIHYCNFTLNRCITNSAYPYAPICLFYFKTGRFYYTLWSNCTVGLIKLRYWET